VQIEVLRVDSHYLSDKGLRETQVIWKTDAAVLYQIRRGYNCRTGEPLDKVAYSGVTTAEKENVLRISAPALKPGINILVICVNRAPLSESTSQELDYGTGVYEKNLALVLDTNPPFTYAEYTEGENAKLQLVCYDEGACDAINYTLEGEGRRESFQEKGKTGSLTFDNSRAWVETIHYFSTDKAGNREQVKELKINRGGFQWFGQGRFSAYPIYLARLDAKQALFAGGWGIGLAGDFPVSRLLNMAQKAYLPGIRFEGKLLTFTNGANTEDGLSEIAAGFLWLMPLKKGNWGALAAGTTFGLAKYFSIVNARQVASVVAWSANVSLGYEYAYKQIFAFVYWRYLYAAAAPDNFSGHGPSAGVGIVF
jgi:hypothetical protein